MGSYKRDGECLLRCTIGVFKCRLGKIVVTVLRKLLWIEEHKCQEPQIWSHCFQEQLHYCAKD
jgi:hypothetical protein